MGQRGIEILLADRAARRGTTHGLETRDLQGGQPRLGLRRGKIRAGLRNFLRGRLSTFVGDLSFPVYLVQFAVIISFESWLVTVWSEHRAATAWLPLIGVSAVLVTLLVAWIFRLAEKSLLHRLDGVVLRVLSRNAA